MNTLKVRIFGDPVLRKKSKFIEDFNEDLNSFLDELAETMMVEDGIGLAAPQVGVSKRIIVVNPNPEEENELRYMINPRILSTSRESSSMEEGCLSFPGITGKIIRPYSIDVEYIDREGKKKVILSDGLEGRIIQHEMDHLDGTLFIDRMSRAKRILLKPRLRELKKIGGFKE